MAYTKTPWVDDHLPAINASNLNKIEDGIYDAQSSIRFKVCICASFNTSFRVSGTGVTPIRCSLAMICTRLSNI